MWRTRLRIHVMYISEQTVKSYVSSILTKLDLKDRTQAAIFGLQQGLVPLDEALQPRNLAERLHVMLRADGPALTDEAERDPVCRPRRPASCREPGERYQLTRATFRAA